MKLPVRFLLLFAVSVAALSAQTNALLQKARAYLGSESALSAVKSVHYTGKLKTSVVSSTGEEVTAEADILITFAKPYYQRIEIVATDKREITALDDYEAWQRIQNSTNEAQWRMTILDAPQVRRLRANTWENLNFFGNVSKIGGRVEDLGLVDMDGQKLHKVAFIHSPEVVFFRFFDPVSGQLVVTQTDSAAEIRETGENRVAGVRFPRKVVTSSTRPDGSKQVVQVTFESIKVNEGVDRAQFRMPSVTGD
jgi:hypothetical protein